MTSSSSISTLEIRQWETSRFYLRVEWTSAFKGFYSKLSLDEKWDGCNAGYESWTSLNFSDHQCWTTQHLLKHYSADGLHNRRLFLLRFSGERRQTRRGRRARETCATSHVSRASRLLRSCLRSPEKLYSQDSALKTATRLALNLPWRRFCPCKANHLSVDY